MARRIGEPVMVRAEEDGVPGTFLWHDRIYVVREVLGHWQERRSWWATAAARAVHGDTASDAAGDAGAGAGGDSSSHSTLDHEREIWRVEASPGRMFGNGVYDLARDGAVDERVSAPTADGSAPTVPAVARPGPRWHLLRVAD